MSGMGQVLDADNKGSLKYEDLTESLKKIQVCVLPLNSLTVVFDLVARGLSAQEACDP